jgi:hypothetical protein
MSLTRTNAKRRRVNSAPDIKLMVHHQLPGIKLVSPICVGSCAVCRLLPVQRVDIGSIVQAIFSVDPVQDESVGILICKLERINTDELGEYETTFIQSVIIWKIDRFERFLVATYMIEHDEGHIWNRNKLMKLAEEEKLFDIQHVPIEETWLTHNGMVLKTRVNVIHEGKCCKLEMAISETSIKDDTQRPLYIDVDR